MLTQDKLKKLFVEKLVEWGTTHVREFPWRNTDSPLAILISEMFLQKTPAERVAGRYSDLIREFTADSRTLDEDSLVRQFSDLGLKKRVKWLIQLRQIVDKQFNGIVPDRFEELLSLPGVGLYTASAVSCFAFNEPVPLVDVNVIRVLSRTFSVSPTKPLRIESEIYKLAASLVPEDKPRLYNYSLLDLGALICRKKPDCPRCPVRFVCHYSEDHYRSQ